MPKCTHPGCKLLTPGHKYSVPKSGHFRETMSQEYEDGMNDFQQVFKCRFCNQITEPLSTLCRFCSESRESDMLSWADEYFSCEEEE